MLLKNRFFFTLAVISILFLQVWFCYLSFNFFLEDNYILAFTFFLLVPFLALLIAIYFLWYRQQKIIK